MITATKLRNNTNFLLNDAPHKVLDYKHTHMSRGGGSVKVRVKNLETGNVTQKTFQSTEKVEEIDVAKKVLQYLYRDEDSYIFMNQKSFQQTEIGLGVIGDDGIYLKEGQEIHVLFYEDGSESGKPLGLELPPKMQFTVSEAAPGEKGDSASNVYKDATLENGLKVRVPLFINTGDTVRVDTRDGSYVERVS